MTEGLGIFTLDLSRIVREDRHHEAIFISCFEPGYVDGLVGAVGERRG